jgi:DmsE family decaheme c-type cytochrome
MMRALIAATAAAWILVVALAAAPPQAQAPQGPSASTGRSDPANPRPAAAFIGSDNCIGCHDGQEKSIAESPHGKASDPRTPAAFHQCETCHGPGEKHLEDPSVDSSIRKFAKMAPRDTNAVCLSCHTASQHAAWQGSPHDARSLSCTTCHSVHAAKSETSHLKASSEVQLCATCHKVQVAKLQRASHMPVAEGHMQCSSCHNPHGSTNVRQLRVGNWINESCVSCHTEKRGPFLFEHAAGRESCVSCHDPHGSINDRLLVAKLPMLCQRCHIGTRHPSTIYDNLSIQSRSVRIVDRGCINCHSQIHGSNHPSGQTLTR